MRGPLLRVKDGSYEEFSGQEDQKYSQEGLDSIMGSRPQRALFFECLNNYELEEGAFTKNKTSTDDLESFMEQNEDDDAMDNLAEDA